MVATSIQRSPGSGVHGKRVKTTRGVPVAWQAATALADMREANGWVASTTASDPLAREKRGQTFGAAKAADALRNGCWRGVGRRPRQRQDGHDIGLIGDPPRERACFRRAAENEQTNALQWAAP